MYEFFFGYWLFTKKHPEFVKRKFTDYSDLIEAEVQSLNTIPGMDPHVLVDTLDDVLLRCTTRFTAKVYLEMWNELIDRYEYYDFYLKHQFRLYDYDYRQCMQGNFTMDYREYAKDQYPKAIARLQHYNRDYFHFEPIRDSEVAHYREVCKRFKEELEELIKNLEHAFSRKTHKLPFMVKHTRDQQ